MKQYINYRCSLVKKGTGELFGEPHEIGAYSPKKALERFRKECENAYMRMPGDVDPPNYTRSIPPAPEDYPQNWEYRAEALPYRWYDCTFFLSGNLDTFYQVYAADEPDAEERVLAKCGATFRRQFNAKNSPWELRITEIEWPEIVTLNASQVEPGQGKGGEDAGI